MNERLQQLKCILCVKNVLLTRVIIMNERCQQLKCIFRVENVLLTRVIAVQLR